MKIIKDLVHGYIGIDWSTEEIINTIYFQRLRDIKQLTAYHVFPSANHTRFEHSLGVMYLSRKALWRLRESLESNGVDSEKFDILFKHLNVASLLHDVGHAPFSHLGEMYYRPKEIRVNLDKIIQEKQLVVAPEIFESGSSHELMSCYIILSKYNELLEAYDLELICRCIVGNKYNSTEKWPEDIIIELLNSSTIDMDKLDYLMRDALMTGLDVPKIDVSRLFRNILVNNITKKLTFHHQSIQVIQNIIDSRDSLYLWVYNHHTVVYTDFIMGFYIRHLIINFEDKKTWHDELNPEEFFSTEAVANCLISDADLWKLLKNQLLIDKSNLSSYTKTILPQLFERQFLKPLWKTIYEFNVFINSNVKDDGLREELIKKLCQESHVFRAYIVKEIIKKCGIKHAEIFIIPRSNKFYSLKPQNMFKVLLDESDRNISTLLPQKDFRELKDVAFYICCKEDKKQEVMECFIEIANLPLPNEKDLEKVATLKWFDMVPGM